MSLKHHLNRHPVPDWVHQQVYLHPYPKELMLRNHAGKGPAWLPKGHPALGTVDTEEGFEYIGTTGSKGLTDPALRQN
jgi:hypothetical protein